MLSKQVKQRRRANRAKRRLCTNRETRVRVHLAIRSGCHQQLLSSKHIEASEARLDAWSDFNSRIVRRKDLPELEQKRLALIDQYTKQNPSGWIPGMIILEDADFVHPKKD